MKNATDFNAIVINLILIPGMDIIVLLFQKKMDN